MMRRFEDGDGRSWDAVVGRESWGTHFAIFIPVEGGPGPRQTPLAATSVEEANLALDALDDEGLRMLLERSEPKSQ